MKTRKKFSHKRIVLKNHPEAYHMEDEYKRHNIFLKNHWRENNESLIGTGRNKNLAWKNAYENL